MIRVPELLDEIAREASRTGATALLSPRSQVRIRPDPACTVEDHLYFEEAPCPGS